MEKHLLQYINVLVNVSRYIYICTREIGVWIKFCSIKVVRDVPPLFFLWALKRVSTPDSVSDLYSSPVFFPE